MEELNDVEIERNIIKAMVQDRDFLAEVVSYQILTVSHFSDLFHKDIFRALNSYYQKYSCAPDEKRLKFYVSDYITFHKKFKKRINQKEVYHKSIERLFSPLDDFTFERRDIDISNLEEMRKARTVQNTLIECSDLFEDGEYSKAFETMAEAVKRSKHTETIITEGDIVGDLQQHIDLINKKQSGEIKPVKTNLVVSIEKTYSDDIGASIKGGGVESDCDYEVVQLDDLLEGGFFPGDLIVIIGETSIGKSMSLMNFCYNIASLDKLNTVLFTIEMSKMKQEMRIYSRLTGIPFSKFRKGELDDYDMKLLKNKLDEWEEKNGMFYVVSFDTGATVDDIKNKMEDVQNRTGKRIDFVAVDYLNDMTPVGNFQSSKGWDALGSISWEMANLAKYWNGHKGIPILTANQRATDTSKQNKGSNVINWTDVAMSKMIAHHASVGIGLSYGEGDKAMNRIRGNIWKNRDGEQINSFYLFPDYKHGKLTSLKRLYRHYDIRDTELDEY